VVSPLPEPFRFSSGSDAGRTIGDLGVDRLAVPQILGLDPAGVLPVLRMRLVSLSNRRRRRAGSGVRSSRLRKRSGRAATRLDEDGQAEGLEGGHDVLGERPPVRLLAWDPPAALCAESSLGVEVDWVDGVPAVARSEEQRVCGQAQLPRLAKARRRGIQTRELVRHSLLVGRVVLDVGDVLVLAAAQTHPRVVGKAAGSHRLHHCLQASHRVGRCLASTGRAGGRSMRYRRRGEWQVGVIVAASEGRPATGSARAAEGLRGGLLAALGPADSE
jgi:hypothetical protein